jgi:hypothetical protein
MQKGVQSTITGIFICILALLMWRLTHNFIGWFIIFVPASFYTLYGVYHIFKDD